MKLVPVRDGLGLIQHAVKGWGSTPGFFDMIEHKDDCFLWTRKSKKDPISVTLPIRRVDLSRCKTPGELVALVGGVEGCMEHILQWKELTEVKTV